MSNVQISKELFVQLVKFHCLEEQTPEISEIIKKELEIKLDKIVNRDLFSTYKSQQATPEERQAAIQQYIANRQK